jgi:hypothetical protein
MYAVALRAGRLPRALTLLVLGACADQPTAPRLSTPLRPNAAVGDVYTVTNPNDDGSIGTLRWALKFTTGGEVIRFDPSLAGKTIKVDSTINISKAVTIEGPTPGGVTLKGAGNGRLFRADYTPTGTITFRNVAITGANSGEGGGGVIYGAKHLVLENSLLYDNTAGSAIAIVADTLEITNSTITGTKFNTAPGFDHPLVLGTLVIATNSTISHNAWGGLGGEVSTVRVVLRNSVLSDNGGKNCPLSGGATLVREGKNISDDDTCGGPSDIIIADPKLGPLADNGGPTMTRALLAGSPAINAGATCSLTVDQRYMARDQQCDLGAFEFADFTKVTITIDPTSIVKPTGWAVVTGTVTCSRPEVFSVGVELKQSQKVGKSTANVSATSTVPFACSTTARPFSASMVLASGVFENGTAQATVSTVDAEGWVTPASVTGAVKLFRSR